MALGGENKSVPRTSKDTSLSGPGLRRISVILGVALNCLMRRRARWAWSMQAVGNDRGDVQKVEHRKWQCKKAKTYKLH